MSNAPRVLAIAPKSQMDWSAPGHPLLPRPIGLHAGHDRAPFLWRRMVTGMLTRPVLTPCTYEKVTSFLRSANSITGSHKCVARKISEQADVNMGALPHATAARRTGATQPAIRQPELPALSFRSSTPRNAQKTYDHAPRACNGGHAHPCRWHTQ